MAAREDLLEKGFQLAYFIFPSRPVAVRVLAAALNKLKAQHGRENHRAYWRDKYLKRGITRISREETDALQWLILFESDRFEKEEECSGGPSAEAMAIRYIKSLVRLTTAMSSFYVNIGLHRLLHNYSTAEAQRIYEAVTERYLGADEYRRAKAVLMDRLGQRFGSFLKTFRTQHGELRFEAWPNQAPWSDLVNSCLTRFIPWTTYESCPRAVNRDAQAAASTPLLPLPASNRANPDQIEMERCHAFIDPFCYTRVTYALTIDPPDQKLALPRFFMENAKSETRNDPPPRLTAEERKAIGDHLSAEAARRHGASAQVLKVIVDGAERVSLDCTQASHRDFEIEEGVELIELSAKHQGEDVLLATNRVRYATDSGFAPSAATVFLRGGNRLQLSISPTTQSSEGRHRAVVRLELRVHPVAAWVSRTLWRPAPGYAFAVLALLALGWVLSSRMSTDRGGFTGGAPPSNFSSTSTSPAPGPAQAPHPVTVPGRPTLVASYRLTPDDLAVRGKGGSDVPSIPVSVHSELVELELPVAQEDLHKAFRVDLKPFLGSTEILRENMLRAKTTPSGGIVRFWVPTAVLEIDRDYAVDLRSWGSGGKLEEENSFTFRTVGKQE